MSIFVSNDETNDCVCLWVVNRYKCVITSYRFIYMHQSVEVTKTEGIKSSQIPIEPKFDARTKYSHTEILNIVVCFVVIPFDFDHQFVIHIINIQQTLKLATQSNDDAIGLSFKWSAWQKDAKPMNDPSHLLYFNWQSISLFLPLKLSTSVKPF